MKTLLNTKVLFLILIMSNLVNCYSQNKVEEEDFAVLFFYPGSTGGYIGKAVYINEIHIGGVTAKNPSLVYKVYSEGELSIRVVHVLKNGKIYTKNNYPVLDLMISNGDSIYLEFYSKDLGRNYEGGVKKIEFNPIGEHAFKKIANKTKPVFIIEDRNNPIIKEELVIERPGDVITSESEKPETVSKPETIIVVDHNIPKSDITKPYTYALVIGNEDYSSYQTDLSSEVNVDYAVNDANIFKEYLIKTIGVPEKNITFRTNATLAQMKQALFKLATIAEIKGEEAELILYYSGHGLPTEDTHEPALIPVDVSGTDMSSAILLSDVYRQLTQYPTQKVTVFLDACFSGGARNQPMIAMRGIKVPPKEETLSGNLIVFSSSTGEESSGAYHKKQHGMFTYFLLKKLQETKGDVTYKELSDYIYDNVREESVLVNEKLQTPQTLVSPDFSERWETFKLK